ncbi:MAG: GMC family oxidoreductase [Candidatus Woesearchaeota archaeon]
MSSYDYVIVGAGSAGCLLANRLSADGSTVLLLEAGGSDRRPEVKVPAAFPNQFQTGIDWNYMSEPEPGLFGRRLYLPRGKMIGGSSSMNAMLYVRGNRADYDAWESEFGASGWRYDQVLPYFKRHEANAELSDDYHGTAGELQVTRRRWLSPHWQKFIDAAGAIGIDENPDYNGGSQDGASLFQTTTRGGRRWSAADAFLRPALKRDHLELVSKALVHRVVLQNGRAVGVDYEHGGSRATARAEREVVVCAGAYGSPQLLMLSGIGPASHLRDVGIEPLVDSPNVGRHLQEHPVVFCNWHSNDPATLDDATRPRYLVQWLATRRGKLSSTVAEAVIHWRSEASRQAPDFQIYFGPVYFWEHGFRKTGTPAITLAAALQAPESRGEVRLRSARAAEHPRILNNLLSQDSEIDAMLRALDLIAELARKRPLAGLLGEQLNPGATVRSRQERIAWLRATAEHFYHPACSCRIGSREEGVVDSELRVHGVDGLRVADASVMPRVTSGNTNAPTYMIAERCAAMMLEQAAGGPKAPAVPAAMSHASA